MDRLTHSQIEEQIPDYLMSRLDDETARQVSAHLVTCTGCADFAATVEPARLPGGDIEAALAALAEHEERVGHGVRMNVRYRLWELTQDQAHLAEAHRLLAFMRDHAPEDCRTSMIENVPLHRDIMRAWEEHGGSGAS